MTSKIVQLASVVTFFSAGTLWETFNLMETRKQKIKTRSYPAVRETIPKNPIRGEQKRKAGEIKPYHHMRGRMWRIVESTQVLVCNVFPIHDLSQATAKQNSKRGAPGGAVTAGGESRYPPLLVHRAQDEHRQAYITGTSI